MEVFIIAAVSVNGMIAEEKDQVSLDWTSKDDLQFFIEKTKEAGVVVMGRTTYETIGKPLKGRLNVVMTRHPEDQVNIDGELEWTSDPPEEIVKKLKLEGRQKVAICGGASIYSLFLHEGLVTDLYLTVEPVIFGNGTPLVSSLGRLDLQLIEHQKLGEQAVMLHYKIK
ncbi:MAG: dihydrofolate reductase family protein [Patescibacteria group bacterium]